MASAAAGGRGSGGLAVKDEPISPTGMELDLLVPQVCAGGCCVVL